MRTVKINLSYRTFSAGYVQCTLRCRQYHTSCVTLRIKTVQNCVIRWSLNRQSANIDCYVWLFSIHMQKKSFLQVFGYIPALWRVQWLLTPKVMSSGDFVPGGDDSNGQPTPAGFVM